MSGALEAPARESCVGPKPNRRTLDQPVNPDFSPQTPN
jgi:hypothetical protein